MDAVEQGVLSWILKRIRMKMPFDANKLYASEILSILLQNHEENRKTLGEVDGIDILLQQLAVSPFFDSVHQIGKVYVSSLWNLLSESETSEIFVSLHSSTKGMTPVHQKNVR